MAMSHLGMVEARLPPGFRFHPRDDELVCDYLERKVSGENGNGGMHGWPVIVDVDLNKCEPWELPGEFGDHHLMRASRHERFASISTFIATSLIPQRSYLFFSEREKQSNCIHHNLFHFLRSVVYDI